MIRFFSYFTILIMLVLQGCNVTPSLTDGFIPSGKISDKPAQIKKVVVMKPLDNRIHAGTTPVYKAYIPFYPFVKIINEPETFVFKWNGSSYDYGNNFAELVAIDLRATGVADDIVSSPSMTHISPLLAGKTPPTYIIRLTLDRLDWQADYTMYGISILGYLPQALGAPSSYGFSFLKFKAEILDSTGKPIAERTFSATENQNGWIYYYSGYLRALTTAYCKVSEDFRHFVAGAVLKP
jgi:hypothetical protein